MADLEFDILEPHPDIHALFMHFNDLYFEGILGAASVEWSSKRMTRSALSLLLHVRPLCLLALMTQIAVHAGVSTLIIFPCCTFRLESTYSAIWWQLCGHLQLHQGWRLRDKTF